MRRSGRQQLGVFILLTFIAIVGAVAQPIYTRIVWNAVAKRGMPLDTVRHLAALGVAVAIGVIVFVVLVLLLAAVAIIGKRIYTKIAQRKSNNRLP